MPDGGDPQSLNRYSYVYNNPINHTDTTGHCIDGITTLVCIAIGVGIALKVADYGWTLYDLYQSGRVLNDPGASQYDKLMAGLNIGLAVLFEAGEPDDLLPAGLPLDDVARRAIMKGAREAYEAGGEEALEKFLREQLGDRADDVLQKLGLGRTADPNKLSHIFGKPTHQLNDLVKAFGGEEDAFWAVYDEFAKVAGNYTPDELAQGIEVVVGDFTVTVRGAIVNGEAKIGTFFIP